jgi:nitroreductase
MVMDIIEAIKKRKSIRDFKNDEIPQAIIREILEIACRAPSAMNTQPWEFIIITKDTLSSIKSTVIEKLKTGEKTNEQKSISCRHGRPALQQGAFWCRVIKIFFRRGGCCHSNKNH